MEKKYNKKDKIAKKKALSTTFDGIPESSIIRGERQSNMKLSDMVKKLFPNGSRIQDAKQIRQEAWSRANHYEIHIIWRNGNIDTRTSDTLAKAQKEIDRTFKLFGDNIKECHVFECKRIDVVTFEGHNS